MLNKNKLLFFLLIIGYQNITFGAFPAWFTALLKRLENTTIADASSITLNFAQLGIMFPYFKNLLEDRKQKEMNNLQIASQILQLVNGINTVVVNPNFKNATLVDKYICYRLALRDPKVPFKTFTI
ncbi:hypothetical protein EKK58_01975 [Candidatus Dependentiae bacterium]|nr:MAG: hypothetical protein EKK58_01975 [Candidatus Dependentiae bacterium]